MTTATLFPDAPDITAEDYCVFGVATCFLRDEGEIQEIEIVEPIPSSALETLLKGVPTSYRVAFGKSVADFFNDQTLEIPSEFPANVRFCDDFTDRAIAAVRTYKRKPEAQQHIPLGTKKEDFNYSLERKRILNMENLVSTEDNVKQHSHTHKVL
ncbi:hypothetical protein IQ249_01500 [Lusitaniella coriacea LEGE 07157]|uniref:Uncharacterized protein n=1 Tax=Lusitaniella coriacea LEGE 07157 TaxID=945747 RepID=A0A8J7DUU6_9CYAN|nr:hypothetical protein [Lusitaniella coriacea]MBE9114560.1 hypothetical protein [Lusitaniella coriacea LEGE 07157]